MADAPTFRIYNSLTRQTEPIEPISPGHLRFYGCGPTVYTYAHIGNFRSFLTSDLILRTARAIGWDVTYVSNVTDVGHLTQDDLVDPSGADKMAAALEREGERFANIYDLARFYTNALVDDWHALNLVEPDVRPRATEHVTDQLKAVIQLVEQGAAYATDRGVYFSVEAFPDYGKLSGNDAAEQLQATDRETVADPDKRDPRDFALWKLDDAHLMQWHSPWGWGYPGWHIECSVMGMKYLGERFDLHTGGEDLTFPHHECEIAQNESLTGHQSVNYWVHTRFLQVEGKKMSKSSGTFYTVRDLIAPTPTDDHVPAPIRTQGGVDPLALRYALISGQYRKPFNFTLKTLRDSARAVRRYQALAENAAEALDRDDGDETSAPIGEALQAQYDAALQAMCDDLNTPAALAAALDGVKTIERALDDPWSAADGQMVHDWLHKIDDLLGIVYPATDEAADEPTAADDDDRAATIDALIAAREAARAAGNYDRADEIRDRLDAMGIEVMDGPDGTTWREKVTI
ncbi:cysteine--tRNA ligase [Salisaeta longa]|uniref:cysteine--tRNA ligase n=1 Tax=Salisaeta longa TaxID=503170 RepID=UPI0003B34395|nr:cysteine--tRNA ligase [Salisaeta longa]